MTSYRFYKVKNGLSSFAAIGLEPGDDSGQSVEWAESVRSLAPFHAEAVAAGIRDALRWHAATGGMRMNFRVVEFTELLVDTKSDAVRRAATMAAWKALGHGECGIGFAFEGEWKAFLATEG